MISTVPHSVRTVDVPCPLCGAHDDEHMWTGREHEYDNTTDQPFNVVRCRGCGLARLNPRPDVSELNRIYPSNYYAYARSSESSAGNGRLPITERTKMRVFQHWLHQTLDRVDRTDRLLRLLDVGCADGRMLDWARSGRDGHRLVTCGIDFNEAGVAVARSHGHDAVVGRFETSDDFDAGSFDVILASHVVEHVDDPMGFTRRISMLLRPGGIAVISTPNIDSADVWRFREHWGGNHFPRHWTFFDARSMAELARRVGLRVERVDYVPNPIFWAWTAHATLRARFPKSRLPDRLFPPVRIFESSLHSFIVLSAFTTVEVMLKAITGRTASMAVELRAPA